METVKRLTISLDHQEWTELTELSEKFKESPAKVLKRTLMVYYFGIYMKEKFNRPLEKLEGQNDNP